MYNTLTTDGTANADAKSALLRPDSAPREDTDQAIHVRPYNEYKENADDDDFETHHNDFSEHDNDNDKDYSDDDDDDDDDDRYDPDEKSGDWMNRFKRVSKPSVYRHLTVTCWQ